MWLRINHDVRIIVITILIKSLLLKKLVILRSSRHSIGINKRINLDLSKRANDFLQQLPPKQFKQVVSAIFSLLNNPKPFDTKLLAGYDKLYRKDIGEFRIIYRYFQETEKVFIVLVGKRNDDEVYKLLRRLI